jgi:hypothetical protein
MNAKPVKKIYIVSKQRFDGHQRKIAFFQPQPKGLYFDLGGFFLGSHTSYHVDGNIFRTSPATENHPRPDGSHLPLDNFKGWYQLGTSMIKKDSISNKPMVRQRDIKKDIYILEIDLDEFPANTINLVVELLEPGREDLLKIPSLIPPPRSKEYLINKI